MTAFINDLGFIFSYAIPVMIALMLVSLGGLFSERSGVINIALDGIMIMGGFIGALLVLYVGRPLGLPTQAMVLLALVGGAVVGTIFSAAHAFAAIHMNSNQIISATALNMFAPALAVFTARTVGGTERINIVDRYRLDIPLLADIPVLGTLFFERAFLSTFIGIAILIIVTFVFYKTRLGLRLRSVGENPQASESLGIDVYRMRYIGVMTSGFLAGLGGATYLISFDNRFNGDFLGLGFLALAILISGQWKPIRLFIFALIFAMLRVLANLHDSFEMLAAVDLPGQFYRLLPYLFTLIILAFFSKESQAPKALGQAYDQEKR